MKHLVAKIFLMICAVLLLLPYSTVNAKLTVDQIAIGGITYKSSLDYIIGIYGEPDSIKGGSTYCWGDNSLEVYTWDGAHGQQNYATEIRCKKNNGLTTPAGISVGSHVLEMYDVYGTPDYEQGENYFNYSYIYTSTGGPCLILRTSEYRIREIWIVKTFMP